jgi:hypothetical protein
MASLKDMRVRIAATKATQKITKAMQMVAASKLRRAQAAAEAARPYAEHMGKVLGNIARAVGDLGTAPRLLSGTGSDNVHLIVVCTAERGHDCLPAENQCSPLVRETNIAPVFEIDFVGKIVHSPYRRALLRVSELTANAESLVLQGTDLLFAWSALINKTTGALTVSIADREGAYVVFGQCKVATGK